MKTDKRQRGFSLVELMVSITIAMLLSLSVVYVYAHQAAVVAHHARQEQAVQEGSSVYDLLARLLRLGQRGQYSVTYPGTGAAASANAAGALEIAGDGIVIDFVVPAGYPIWPNTTGANNFIRLAWSNGGGNAYELRVAQAATSADLAAAALTTVAGKNTGPNPRIVNVDFWPMQADGVTPQANVTDAPVGGYRFVVTTRAGLADPTYSNPLDPEGALKNYRTSSIAGVIVPRN